MKIIFQVVCICLLFSSPALADWTETFRTTYIEKGIDTAVVTVLSEGTAPVQIMQYGKQIEGLATPELIKALFCALIQPATIYESAEATQIPVAKVEEGYQLALAQCAEEMEEQVNVAPVTPFPGVPPGGRGRPAQASPWNFN